MTDTGYHFEKRYQPAGPARFHQAGWVGAKPTTNEQHRANGAIFILCVGLGSFIGVVLGIIIVSL